MNDLGWKDPILKIFNSK